MLITKEIEVDMGHRVPNHKSKCRNPHGHRYKIEVGVDDKLIKTRGDSSEGMVIDFSDLKNIMIEVLDEWFDHSFTIYQNDKYLPLYEQMKDEGLKINVVHFIPTAENLARFWFELMQPHLRAVGIKIHHVKVWETPSSTAIWQV